MIADSSRVNPAPPSSMNVGQSFECLGHALLSLRISFSVVWYLRVINTIQANMMAEKITVIALVAILQIRKYLLYFWNFLCRRRLVEGSDAPSRPED